MQTIQSLSHIDSNTLALSFAPIISNMHFKKQEYQPRPKPKPLPSQHDENFTLDEKFVSALLPKSQDPDVSETSPTMAISTNNPSSDIEDHQQAQNSNLIETSNFENEAYDALKQQLLSCLNNDLVLIILQNLEAKQKSIEDNIDARRNQLKQLHNQKRIDLLNLHRIRMEKQPERRNEVKIRCDKEHRDLESLLRKEVAEFEEQVNKEFDAATRDQQIMLQNAGVPGIFPTTDPQQIELQSQILNMMTLIAKDALAKKSMYGMTGPVSKQPHHPINPLAPNQVLYPYHNYYK